MAEDCKDGLRCGRNHCGPAYISKDCCRVDDNRWTAESHSWDCCTVENTCAEGRGDCDSDDECDNGLVCGKYACGAGFPDNMSCCIAPVCDGSMKDEDDCCGHIKCEEGEGYCKADWQCA